MNPTLALSTIVRDAASFLPACLESVRGLVDEIVLADTGSHDNTIAIATSFGARVIPIPWHDDFSEARNSALNEVHSDWVLVLDADEQLDAEAATQIPALLSHSASVAGFQVPIRNYVLSLEDRVWDRPAKPNDGKLDSSNIYPAYVEHENVRLFRRDPQIYFTGRVHESVGPRILETGGTLAKASFSIHHFGLAGDAETRARKNLFYRRLGQQKIKDMPQNAQAHFELGLVELDNFGNLSEALALFQRACELNPRMGIAWFFQGVALSKLERYSEALSVLSEAERLGHVTSLLAETVGDAHYNLKHYAEARAIYSRALHRDPSNLLLQSKLGLASVRAGNVAGGLRLIRQAISTRPALGELHDRLILALVWLGHLESAAPAAESKIASIESPEPKDFLRAASLYAKQEKLAHTTAILQAGLKLHRDHSQLTQGLLEITGHNSVPQMATSAHSHTSGPKGFSPSADKASEYAGSSAASCEPPGTEGFNSPAPKAPGRQTNHV